MTNKYRNFPTEVILELIKKNQDIQKSQPHSRTDDWYRASQKLRPLFEEIARRSS